MLPLVVLVRLVHGMGVQLEFVLGDTAVCTARAMVYVVPLDV